MPQTLQETPPTQLLEDPLDYSELPDDQFREVGEKIATINDLTGWELARWAHEAVEGRGWSCRECAEFLGKSHTYIRDTTDVINLNTRHSKSAAWTRCGMSARPLRRPFLRSGTSMTA
jgi:hypothetical protein